MTDEKGDPELPPEEPFNFTSNSDIPDWLKNQEAWNIREEEARKKQQAEYEKRGFKDPLSVEQTLVIPYNFGYLLYKNRNDPPEAQFQAAELEKMENEMVRNLDKVTQKFDEALEFSLGISGKRNAGMEQVKEEYSLAMEEIRNKSSELGAKWPDLPEEDKQPLFRYTYLYGDKEQYESLLMEKGFGAFSMLRQIETRALDNLGSAWADLESTCIKLGLGSNSSPMGNRNPYGFEINRLRSRLVDIQKHELERIIKDMPAYESQTVTSHEEGKRLAFEKAKSHDFAFSLVKLETDGGTQKTYKNVETYTVDPETGIRFITQIPYEGNLDGTNIKERGVPSISAFGPNGEIYYLTPQFREAKYYGEANASTYGLDRKPFYFDYKNARTVEISGRAKMVDRSPFNFTEEKLIAIWEAYQRAECDVEKTQEAYAKETEWRYALDKICWGSQEDELQKFRDYKAQLADYENRNRALVSEVGRVSWGIRHTEPEDGNKESLKPTEQNIVQKLDDELEKWFTNPTESPLASQDDNTVGYVDFKIPVGDRLGIGVELRLSLYQEKDGEREILLVDAPHGNEVMYNRPYLRLSWKKDGKMSVERGWRYETDGGGYLLQDKKESDYLTEFDKETVLTAFKLL